MKIKRKNFFRKKKSSAMRSRGHHAPFIDELHDVAILHDTINFKHLSAEDISLIHEISAHPIVIPSDYFTSKKSFDITYKAVAVFQDAINALFRQNSVLVGDFENAQQQLSHIMAQRDEAIMNAVQSYEKMKKIHAGAVTQEEKISKKTQSEDTHHHDKTRRLRDSYFSLEKAEGNIFACSECKCFYSSRLSLQSHKEKRHRTVVERIGLAFPSDTVPLRIPAVKEEEKAILNTSFDVGKDLPFSNERKAFQGELQNVRSGSKTISPSCETVSPLFSYEVKGREKTEGKSHYTSSRRAISTSSFPTGNIPEKNKDEVSKKIFNVKDIIRQSCSQLSEVEFSVTSCPSLSKSLKKRRRHIPDRHYHEKGKNSYYCSKENGAPSDVSGTTPRKEDEQVEGITKDSSFQNDHAFCHSSNSLSQHALFQEFSSPSCPLAEGVVPSSASLLWSHNIISSSSPTCAADELRKVPEHHVLTPQHSPAVDGKTLISTPTFLHASASFCGSSPKAVTTTILSTTSKAVNASVDTSVVHSISTDARCSFFPRHTSSEQTPLTEVVQTPQSSLHSLLTIHTEGVTDARDETTSIQNKSALGVKEREESACDGTMSSPLYRSPIGAPQAVSEVVHGTEPHSSPNFTTPLSSLSVAGTSSVQDSTKNDKKGEVRSLPLRQQALNSGDANKTALSTGGSSLPLDSKAPSFHSIEVAAVHNPSENSLATTSRLPFLLSPITPSTFPTAFSAASLALSSSSLTQTGNYSLHRRTSDVLEPRKRHPSARTKRMPSPTSSSSCRPPSFIPIPLMPPLLEPLSRHDSISKESADVVAPKKAVQSDHVTVHQLQEESCFLSLEPQKTLLNSDAEASSPLSSSSPTSVAFPHGTVESTHKDPITITSATSPPCVLSVSTALDVRTLLPVFHSSSPPFSSSTVSSSSDFPHPGVEDAESRTEAPPCSALPMKRTLSFTSFAEEASASVGVHDSLLVPHASRSPEPPIMLPSNATARPGKRRYTSSSYSSPLSCSPSSSYTYFCSYSESDETSEQWLEEKPVLSESTDAPECLQVETSLPSSSSGIFDTNDSFSNEEENENEDISAPFVVPASSSSVEMGTHEFHPLPTSNPKKKVGDIFSRLFAKSEKKKKKKK